MAFSALIPARVTNLQQLQIDLDSKLTRKAQVLFGLHLKTKIDAEINSKFKKIPGDFI